MTASDQKVNKPSPRAVNSLMSRSKRFKLGFFLVLVALLVVAGAITANNIFHADTVIPDNRLATVKRDAASALDAMLTMVWDD